MRLLSRITRSNSTSGPAPAGAGPSGSSSAAGPSTQTASESALGPNASSSSPLVLPHALNRLPGYERFPMERRATDMEPSSSTGGSASSSIPPHLAAISNAPIPTYETALSESASGLRRTMSTSGGSTGGPRDYFGQSPGARNESVFMEDDEDDDDPLIPRIMRAPPKPNLLPLRRNTLAAITALGDRPSSAPPREHREIREELGIPPTIPASPLDSPDPEEPPPALDLPPSEAAPTAAMVFESGAAIIELPMPPANALPAYNANLAPDEMRLISTVHLDQNHPAAAFFSALAQSSVSAAPTAPADPQVEQREPWTTGGKKLRVLLRKGGIRMNENGTGPLYVKVGRGGIIEGQVEVGKVDHGISLEISIIGLVNTSYYVRGQYTLIDTLPLVRRAVKLYPKHVIEDSRMPEQEPTTTTTATNSLAATPGAAGGGPPVPVVPAPNIAPTNPLNPTFPMPASSVQVVAFDNANHEETIRNAQGVPLAPTMSKDGTQAFLTPGMVFPFSVAMPNHHYRGNDVELPPSCQIYQVGMQAGVEYVLRVKLIRKGGWRLNETMTMPILYEPQAYIPPRRLRALTVDDSLNPGWRTIRLHGGAPVTKTQEGEEPPPATPGVEGTLLVPSPPILYVSEEANPPPIPFHLHFHSALTLPLATFSDPRESDYVIRLMRVATMRIGTEREIRRMEVPSTVQIWQEGGRRLTLGEDDTPAPSAAAANGDANATASSSTGTAATTPTRPKKERRASSFLRRRKSSAPLSPSDTTTPAAGPSTAAAGSSSATEVAASTVPDASPTSPTSPLSPTSNMGAIAEADAAVESGDEARPSQENANGPNGTIPAPTVDFANESPFTPLALGSTDVHILGELTIHPRFTGTDVIRRLIQSFQTPEIGISYVLEVGIQPKAGAVKENFTHLWGGGLVEVVLGPNARAPRSLQT